MWYYHEGVGRSPQWTVVPDGTHASNFALSGHHNGVQPGCQFQQVKGKDSLSLVIYHLHLGGTEAYYEN